MGTRSCCSISWWSQIFWISYVPVGISVCCTDKDHSWNTVLTDLYIVRDDHDICIIPVVRNRKWEKNNQPKTNYNGKIQNTRDRKQIQDLWRQHMEETKHFFKWKMLMLCREWRRNWSEKSSVIEIKKCRVKHTRGEGDPGNARPAPEISLLWKAWEQILKDGERGTAERAVSDLMELTIVFPYRRSMGSACPGPFVNIRGMKSTDEVHGLLKKALYCQQRTEGKVFHVRTRWPWRFKW